MKLADKASKLYGASRNWLNRARNVQSFDKINMGSSTRHIPGFLSVDMSWTATLRHDVTTPFPLPANSIDLVWSERMYEHLTPEECLQSVVQIAKILKPGGKLRVCLPLCFYGTDSSNMMRANNHQNCRRSGHVTWFTYERMGTVQEDQFGMKTAPDVGVTLQDWFGQAGLELKMLRYYDESDELHYDSSVLSGPIAETFIDEPRIRIRRPDSLIFEGAKIGSEEV